MPVTIFRHENNAKESWLEVGDDGSITYHKENTGWPMMRSGVQEHEKTYTLEEAKVKWPSYADALDKAVRKVTQGQ